MECNRQRQHSRKNAERTTSGFGATAVGRADLKGSAGMPPLRKAAIPLYATREGHSNLTKTINLMNNVINKIIKNK